MLRSLPVGGPPDEKLRAAQRAAIARIDWRDLLPRLESYAIRCGASPGTAPDAVQTVIARLLAGESSWDPAMQPDAKRYLMGAVRGHLSNERRSAQSRYEKPSEKVEQAPDPASMAPIATESREALAEEALARLRSLLKDDAEALAVVELKLAGVDKPAEQAVRLNMPETRVYDARDRIGRCVRRIRRELASRQQEEEVAQ
jgi:DNA-directed RNA polymerase specialized sigma24 family protein